MQNRDETIDAAMMSETERLRRGDAVKNVSGRTSFSSTASVYSKPYFCIR
jgi:hypothetical protein